MARKYTQVKRVKNSYNAYVRNWNNWKSKGYTMDSDAPMPFSEYKENYMAAKDAGTKDIARDFAKADRLFSYEKSLRVYKGVQQITKKEIVDEKKYLEAKEKFSTPMGLSKFEGTRKEAFQLLADAVGYEEARAIYDHRRSKGRDVKLSYHII